MKSQHACRVFALLTLFCLAAGCRSERAESEPQPAAPSAELGPAPGPEPSPEPSPTPAAPTQPPVPDSTAPKSPGPLSVGAESTGAESAGAESTGVEPDAGSPRSLPMPPPATPAPDSGEADAQPSESPNVDAEMGAGSDEYEIDPDILAHINARRAAMRRLADTYDAPPGAKQLGKEPDLWIDIKAKRVYIDGYVAMQRGPLEMFACPVGTKEHESVVAVFAKSSEVHAALLAIGAQSGQPVRWDPEFTPPTGQVIQVWIAWRDAQPQAESMTSPQADADDDDAGHGLDPADELRFIPGDNFSVVDARKWVRNVQTKSELAEPWVFAGSQFWSDPEDNIEHYSADAGDMICVSNFSTAMLDVPFESSADTGNLMFEPFTERVPERGTPVRLVLVPQPIPEQPSATAPSVDPSAPPEESMLPIAAAAKAAAMDAQEDKSGQP